MINDGGGGAQVTVMTRSVRHSPLRKRKWSAPKLEVLRGEHIPHPKTEIGSERNATPVVVVAAVKSDARAEKQVRGISPELCHAAVRLRRSITHTVTPMHARKERIAIVPTKAK